MDLDLWDERLIFQLNPAETIVEFSNDNKTAIVSFDKHVVLVDVANGYRLDVLQHSDTVVGMFFTESSEVMTYTRAGTESLWNIEKCSIMTTRQIEITLKSVWKFEGETLGVSIDQENKFSVWKIAGPNGKNGQILKTEAHNIKRSQYAVTDTHLACCEKLFVYLYIYGEAERQRFKYIGKAEFMDHNLLEFSSIAASGSTVAASLSFGRVFIWKDVLRKGIASFTQSVHWHKWSPCLALTAHGSLISAGIECAVAKFTLATAKNVAKPQLLPHLQAPVVSLHLSQDGSLFAAALADNSLHFIPTATMNVLSSMSCVFRSPQEPLLPLFTDPLYPDYVVHIARPGVIQWFDPSKSATVFTADISRENPVEGNNIFSDSSGYTDICAAAFSLNDAVTCDRFVNLSVPNNRIQFWRRLMDKTKLALDYEIMDNSCEIMFARACNEYNSFLLVDTKGVITTWRRLKGDKRRWYRAQRMHWLGVPVSQITRIQTLHFAAIHKINENEAVVGIWHVEYDKPPRFVHKFVGYGRPTDVEWCGCTHHLLLIATDESVCAFDLKNLSPLWHAFEPNLRIAISAYCGVLYSSNTVFLIDGKSARPLCQRKVNSNIKSAVALGEKSSFTFVFNTEKTYGMMSYVDTEIRHADLPVQRFGSRLFASIMSVNEGEQPIEMVNSEGTPNISLLDGPAYAAAPLPLLSEPFIRSCFLPKV